jgi:hypothetical protein
MAGEVWQWRLETVLTQASAQDRLSQEHVTAEGRRAVDRSLGSRKSFVPKDRPAAQGSGQWGEEAVAGHAWVEDRPGGAALPEQQGGRGEAE